MKRRAFPGFAAAAWALGLALFTREARSCGPCSTPGMWSVEILSGKPVVVTNFGLLEQDERGWNLTCEEVIGGLLLDVQGNSVHGVVSTDTGLFRTPGDLCAWHEAPASTTNDWALSFALPVSADSSSEPPLLALRIDRRTQELRVERSDDGNDFVVLHSFASTSGYRQLVAGGDPVSVFVGGYTYGPRTWNLAFSLDEGEHWSVVSPDVDASSTMSLGLVDPERPRALLVEARSTAEPGDELWRFDAETLGIERVLKLEDAETLAGLALKGESIWVAGRRDAAGSLYRARRDELVFRRAVAAGPAFSCLAAHAGTLYTCVDDLTASSGFIVGRSTDEGEHWLPWLTLSDLRGVTACGDACSTSLRWLERVLGAELPDAGTPDAGGSTPDPAADPKRDPGRSPSASGSCGFGLSPAFYPVFSPVRSLVWIGGLMALVVLAFRRRNSRQGCAPRDATTDDGPGREPQPSPLLHRGALGHMPRSAP